MINFTNVAPVWWRPPLDLAEMSFGIERLKMRTSFYFSFTSTIFISASAARG